ncbi:MAG: NAD(+)/NADH kinase [Dehalococcoidia bacterium]|nr:NAD(+)/NADH kinase [Dehalococcoidia bacterium]
MAGGPIGIIANPASGKDIRRLVAHGSVFDNQEKRSMVRRAVLGALAAGAGEFLFMPGPHRLVEDAFDGPASNATFTPVTVPGVGGPLDTVAAARAMCGAGAAAVLTFGGDGTNRAVAKGWLDVPVIALSTGTNNVFPRMMEATVAGMAAGLVAAAGVGIEEVARQAKRVRIQPEGRPEDLALVDAVLVAERFLGARAVWAPGAIRTLVLARAEPAAIGFSAIGGLLQPIAAEDDAALVVEVGEGGSPLLAPIAPGLFEEVLVKSVRRIELGEVVEVTGPGVLALDGERELPLGESVRVRMTVVRDGPRVIDAGRALRLAACRGLFVRQQSSGGPDGN